MRSFRVFTASSLVLLAAISLTGCAENESSLYIRQVQVEDPETCVVEASAASFFRGAGIIDTAFTSEYSAFLLVGNQVIARGSSDQLRTETSKISLYEYDVRVLDSQGAVISEYTAPTSGFINQRVGETDSFGLAAAILMDAATAVTLGNVAAQSSSIIQVVSSVVMRGRTLGGNEIESGEFLFPISVCRSTPNFHCLLQFPASADDPVSAELDCDNVDDDPDPNCRMGLDRPVDCRQCRGSHPSLCAP